MVNGVLAILPAAMEEVTLARKKKKSKSKDGKKRRVSEGAINDSPAPSSAGSGAGSEKKTKKKRAKITAEPDAGDAQVDSIMDTLQRGGDEAQVPAAAGKAAAARAAAADTEVRSHKGPDSTPHPCCAARRN